MIERTLSFGGNNDLVGTICLPGPHLPAGKGIGQVLFNAGIVHRVGPHRINVRLARRLALRGIPSIRFDLSGQGDSTRSDSSRSFNEQAVVDIRAAMDVLGKEADVEGFTLFGYCSGGRHSYATALVDERVAGIILYDTYTYPTVRTHWNYYGGRIRQSGLLKAAGVWSARLPARLLRWLQGRVVKGGLERPAGAVGIRNAPSKREYADRIALLHRRGVKVGVMFSGENRNFNYIEQFRDAFRKFGIADLVTLDYFPRMDHTATNLEMQADFMQRIEEWTYELDTITRRSRNQSAA